MQTKQYIIYKDKCLWRKKNGSNQGRYEKNKYQNLCAYNKSKRIIVQFTLKKRPSSGQQKWVSSLPTGNLELHGSKVIEPSWPINMCNRWTN